MTNPRNRLFGNRDCVQSHTVPDYRKGMKLNRSQVVVYRI
jgi:hypothetical protein